MPYRKTILIILLLAGATGLFSTCNQDHAASNKDPRGMAYAGQSACLSCHGDILNSYLHNNHYKTSSKVNADSLQKLAGINSAAFYFTDSTFIKVAQKNGSWQQELFNGNNLQHSGQFDIAFGSGEKAQTYASWSGDSLLQLPLTWYTTMHGWANSPGFPSYKARFNRVIESRCFECHASYVSSAFKQSGTLAVNEKLDRNSIVFGIDCERCHGPGAEHVQFQKENPLVKQAKFMVKIGSLSRNQKLDLCSVCHSGNDLQRQQSLFAFQPGDSLSNFYFPDFGDAATEPDVHGKQLQLLQSSLCYKQSNMTCMTCHDSHANETGNSELFITKCKSCHTAAHPALKDETALVNKNCIDCHMPVQPSKTIYFNNGKESKQIPYFLRTHKIAIYP